MVREAAPCPSPDPRVAPACCAHSWPGFPRMSVKRKTLHLGHSLAGGTRCPHTT